jgi:hypothetical protein
MSLYHYKEAFDINEDGSGLHEYFAIYDNIGNKVGQMENENLAAITVHALNEHQDWIAGRVECLTCSHEWVAVRPVLTIVLECPNCQKMSPFEILINE